jgi:glutamyl/glutaminyl-tRNA synthetase
VSERCRFAPTPSGPAHPGTLLAGLLCWLDARSRGAHLLLRLEDVDHTRCTPEHAAEMGDPVLLRRDGAIAYHLAVVVDDAEDGITRIVRGRDLAPSTAIHRVLQRGLGLPEPVTRHHLLLLEEAGGKLAKLHGAVGWHELREHMDGARACGLLAAAAGLLAEPAPITPAALLAGFDWSRVRDADQVMRWTGSALLHLPRRPARRGGSPR